MEPIIALATPPLKSALALIRVSGDGCFEIASELAGKPVGLSGQRELLHAKLSYDGKQLDDVMLLVYPKSKSMTGEEVVEVSCHGSMLIANQIIDAFIALGARYAKRGEFTMRSYLNGKMGLVEAESVNDLINAPTELAKDLALKSLNGEASQRFAPIKDRISALLATIETSIDFPEYKDTADLAVSSVLCESRKIKEDLSSLIKDSEDGRYVKEGVKVAILGEPNVGKSSLLNALLGEQKAIVTPIPGTTRDVVEGELSIHGIPIKLLDTAGLRESDDEVEKIGIRKSVEAVEECDLAILLIDQDTTEEQIESLKRLSSGKKTLLVYNKTDISKAPENCVGISAKEGDVNALKEAIFSCLSLSPASLSAASLSSKRQLSLLKRIDNDLSSAIEGAESEQTLDLVSIPLMDAYNACRELLGLDPTLDLQDEIFSRFCVGK
ncbi:MAG TPA: tRNA uridine-5-carboxymethylaminomethyl(34) synthesis GTPase MnmE [Candidatus Enteromonas pullicola]|uniref:tRNA modification GTPase MnmE n=1 Tax=Candidatus Alloenteromonas pullicola TaxID=2840784 RepID=A0A9D1LPG9_9FIRM|nr:tRNA uridine-5-carboxymethylaminomethyl(34) synthesis GTPase MnmE [Candidatus Enteromonas pullicola]